MASSAMSAIIIIPYH